jgi:hypothetical protein
MHLKDDVDIWQKLLNHHNMMALSDELYEKILLDK